MYLVDSPPTPPDEFSSAVFDLSNFHRGVRISQTCGIPYFTFVLNTGGGIFRKTKKIFY